MKTQSKKKDVLEIFIVQETKNSNLLGKNCTQEKFKCHIQHEERNPGFLLRLHDSSVLQSIIIFNAKSLRINLLFDCFVESSMNSYQRFLYFSLYLFCNYW